MLSFKKFIIESGDSHYSYKKTSTDGKKHTYEFADDVGRKKTVHVIHSDTGHTADVAFHDNDKANTNASQKYSSTGEVGHKAGKVFSTVKHILKTHSTDHPKLSAFSFDSNKKDPSRVKLYTRMAAKMGGASEEGHEFHHHMIPTEKL